MEDADGREGLGSRCRRGDWRKKTLRLGMMGCGGEVCQLGHVYIRVHVKFGGCGGGCVKGGMTQGSCGAGLSIMLPTRMNRG